MMELNLMVAGFGGQGVMVIGKLLSESICESTDYHVTFFPSYGAQQRGGTANCYVVVSDEEVGSPKPNLVDQLIVMNDVSMVTFSKNVRSGGTGRRSIFIRFRDILPWQRQTLPER